MRGLTKAEAERIERKTSGERFEPWTADQMGPGRYVVGMTTANRQYLVYANDGNYIFSDRASFIDFLRMGQAPELILEFRGV